VDQDDSVEEQIARLRQEGRIDSEGQFSIDRENALRRFGQLGLPEKSLYILKLVQWAVASGATCINFEIGSNRVCCSHDGNGMGPERFNSLLGFASPAKNRAERHLQVACACILSLSPSDLVLESQKCRVSTRDGLGEFSGTDTRLTIVGAKVERFSRVARAARPFIHFDLGGNTLRDLWSFLGRAEIALLRTYCEGGSVPIWLNGFCVNRPDLGLENRAVRTDFTSLAWNDTYVRHSFFLLNTEPQPFSLTVPKQGWGLTSSFFNEKTDEDAQENSLRFSDASGCLDAIPQVPLRWKGLPMLSCSVSTSVTHQDMMLTENLVHHFYDGVRVEAEAGPCLKQKVMKTFVACPELKLDLSGLRVQRDTTWSALNERLLSFLQVIADKGSWIVKA
jgi:hypothetical protein